MYAKYIKRVLDLIISLMTIPVVLVIMIPISIMIKLDDRGSVFFSDYRLGKDMKKFKMYKFRTMKMNAPDIRNDDGSTYNSMDDKRLTRVGKYLRITSIDELPQVFNVFIGQMSFIGPRPSPLGNESTYSEDYLRKFTVRPGITGYNQAVLRNCANREEREKNDIFYIDNISFLLDIKIIFLTIRAVIKRENIYKK